jgi:CRP/FNR family transcriptional regulator, anaerobic regulatory protein
MNDCTLCVVRNRAICAPLDASEVDALNSISRRRRLSAGETLAWEGDDSILVANVVEGILKLSNGTQDGREQIVGIVFPSDFIGRPFGQMTDQTITSLTDALVCVFARNDFDRFAQDHPGLQRKLLDRTLSELDRTRRWMLLLGRKSAEEKLVTFLLEMAERLNVSTGCQGSAPASNDQFTLPFTRQQIADILGLTIETVSRLFTKLRNERLVRTMPGRVVAILDRNELESRSG